MKLRDRLRSVGFTLAVWYALVLLAAFALFGSSIYVYLRTLLQENLRETLAAEVEWTKSMIDLEMQRAPAAAPPDSVIDLIEEIIDEHFAVDPRNYIVLLTTSDGRVLYETLNRKAKNLSSGYVPADTTLISTVSDPHYKTLLVAAQRRDPFIIQIAYSTANIDTALRHIVTVFLVLVPIALVFAFAGGLFMANLSLRPVHQISGMARRITAENLGERIPPRGVSDELGELIQTINGMIERLDASFNQMKQFSVDVAHELKTPLTILKGESELALTKTLTQEEMQEILTSFLEEIVRLSRIVDDLLTLTKADAGQLTLRREPLRLDAVLEELCEDAVALGANKEIRVDLGDHPPAAVLGDPLRIRQLFRNLIKNAVQYTDRGGIIQISSRIDGARVVTAIRDSGMGITPEQLKKIFDRFYRADEARSRLSGGSGLGLSIARRMAELQGGSIRAESSPGHGTTFFVELPLHPPAS